MTIYKKLKAFVRFDGSGRVVAGSLILRKKQPKVGRWQEISAYECCQPQPGRAEITNPIVVDSFDAISIDITWTASVAGTTPIAGYNILLDGIVVGFVAFGTEAYTYAGLDPDTSYSLSIQTVDGNYVIASDTLIQVTAVATTTTTTTT